jgi:hypothetical protein
MEAMYRLLSSKPYVMITAPKSAKVLSVQMQNDYVTLWLEVESESELVTRLFGIFGSGEEVKRDGNYVGTVQVPSNIHPLPPHVWHVYDFGEVEEKNKSTGAEFEGKRSRN